MKCYLHIDREAEGMCTSCGKPVCRECIVTVENRFVCRECLSSGRGSAIMINQSRPPKDKSTAMILEILPALFGLFGFGWIYSGNTNAGILWLIGVIIWDIFAAIILAVTAGFGCFCTLPVNILLIVISASSLNSYIKGHTELFGKT